jgi:hypothetical protein
MAVYLVEDIPNFVISSCVLLLLLRVCAFFVVMCFASSFGDLVCCGEVWSGPVWSGLVLYSGVRLF